MKLQSMTAFVLEQKETDTFDLSQIMWYDKEVDKLEYIRNYAEFLSQPLHLGFFVPCDLEGNVLHYEKTEAEKFRDENSVCRFISKEEINFHEAQKRVLFEGWEVEKDMHHDTKRATYHINGLRIGVYLEYSYGKQEFLFQLNHSHKTIEDLAKYDLTLTQSAINKIKGV